MPVMVETGTLMCYGETDEGEQRQRFVERLAVQPELAGFRRCLSLFLAGLPEFDARQPDATALDTLPNTPGCMVRCSFLLTVSMNLPGKFVAPGALCKNLEQPFTKAGALQLHVQLVCALDTFGCQVCHGMHCPWYALHASP